jgi:hypothetical protein
MLVIEHYKYRDIPDAVWDEWQNCCEQWNAYPFQSADWLRSVIEIAPAKSGAALMVARDETGCIAFLPYRISHGLSGRVLPITFCRPWSSFMPTWILAAPGRSKCDYQNLVDGFHSRISKWHKMITGYVCNADGINQALSDFFAKEHLRNLATESGMNELRDVPTFDEFLRSLSKHWRRNYRSTKRKMIDSGRAVLTHYEDFEKHNLETIKQRIMGIYRETWKASSDDKVWNLTFPEAYEIFSCMLDHYESHDGLHVALLTVDGEDAAFFVGVHRSEIYCSVQMGYKPQFKDNSVGFLILMESFRYSIEKGFTINNLLGTQSNQVHFPVQVQEYTDYVVYNNNLLGMLAAFLVRMTFMKRYFNLRKPKRKVE